MLPDHTSLTLKWGYQIKAPFGAPRGRPIIAMLNK
jgi:hypothetical protein